MTTATLKLHYQVVSANFAVETVPYLAGKYFHKMKVEEENEKTQKIMTMIMFLNKKTYRMYQLSMRIPQNMKKKKI